MTESAAYHAIPNPEQSGSGQGGEHGRRASRGLSPEKKASNARTTVPSGSTEEALVDMDDDRDAASLPQTHGSEATTTTCFHAGYGRNSYFTWRLRMSVVVVAIAGTAGTLGFWASSEIGYGGVYVPDVKLAVTFRRANTRACVAGTDYCGTCDVIVVYAMLVYHVAPLMVILGLPASGLPLFEPFRRLPPTARRQKIQRTVFFQVCELLSVGVLVCSVVVIFYFMYALFQGTNFFCNQVQAIVYVACAVVTFGAYFVELTYFARFREHLSMQLGAFRETDQTGGIRARLARRRRRKGTTTCTSERAQVVADVRKHLYQETSLGNVAKLESLLAYATERLGTEFAHEMYSDATLVLKLFGRSKKNPMHVAAYLGNVPALQLLFDAGLRVDSYDKVARVRFTTGDLFWTFAQIFVSKPLTSEDEMAASIFRTTLVTPLHCAVSTGQIQAVQWLLQHGANVNLKSKASYWSDRIPPLFVADNPEIVALLLEAGANHLDVPDPGHMNTLTVLQMAYMRGNFPVAHELEEWGADVALTPLHEAAAKNHTGSLRNLLKLGADPNCMGEYGYTGMHRRTPLHWAAINGAVDAVHLLLDAGSDANFQDVFGRSPLHWAARVNKPAIVRILLTHGGANVNLRDYRDHTPLLCAASCKNVSVALFDLLVAHGADLTDRLANGDTALHVAMKCELKGTALALVEAGADVMATNRDGYRPVDCTTSTQLQFEIKQAAGERDVMISYTHSHRAFALKLRDSLERAKITSWLDLMDPTGIGGGSVWREEIARGIKHAQVILCLYTDDYARSEWCLKELALAKELGKPIIAVSLEGAPVPDEMQVYIYTRQMVPFECAIETIHHQTSPRAVTYEYDEARYAAQFRLLLDGVRDEIEKHREAHLGRRLVTNTSAIGFSEPLPVDDWDPTTLETVNFAFLAHGDHHHAFVRRLHDRLVEHGVTCVLDGTQACTDMTARIHAAKEAILKCDVFLVVLSRKTVHSELVKDQLALAEDKGKLILPVMLNDMDVPLDKHYTLSRVDLVHFTPDLGFNASFVQLLGRVRDKMTTARHASFTAPTRPTFRTLARVTALSRARQPTSTAATASARGLVGRPRLSESTMTLV